MTGPRTKGRALVAACTAIAAACSTPIVRARHSLNEPPSGRELAARGRSFARNCPPVLRIFFPGVGQICLKKLGEGAALAALGAAELGTAIAVAANHRPSETESLHPGVALPVLAFADLYLYGLFAPTLDLQLAAGERFVPQDTLPELALAPFNVRVLGEPEVWAGILVTSIVMGLRIAVEDGPNRGMDPIVFRKEVVPSTGYPVATATYAGLFMHVAIAEETVFRGFAQSGLARWCGEWCGWGLASAMFGAAHIPNSFSYPEEENGTHPRRNYLTISVPIITAVGGYMGWVYKRTGYSLAAPVALHFWYDLILTMADFIINPREGTISGKIAIPF